MTESKRTTTRPVRSTAVAMTCCVLALAACGDDGDDDADTASTDASVPSTTLTPSTDPALPSTTAVAATTLPDTTPPTSGAAQATTEPTAPPTTDSGASTANEPALCEPYLEMSAAFAGEPDPDTIGGLLDQIEADAPDEIAGQLAVLTDGARTVLETGDFTVFEDPEFAEAGSAADTWIFENCEFATTAEIVATDYRYEGLAAEYPAGRTGFSVVNNGAEAHELAIIRKNDGVELTLDELLELPESESASMTTYVGATFVGPPGARSNLVVDLTPGNYIAVCNVPAGSTFAEDGSVAEGAGQPHVMLGMSFEFAVT